MLKILHIIDSAGLYGAEMVVLSLMECQKRQEYNPTLLSLGDSKEGSKDIEIEAKRRGLAVFALRFQKGLNFRGSVRILDYAKIMGAHVIHSHGYKGNILFGLAPGRYRKIPAVTSVHGWITSRLFSKMTFYRLLDTMAIKNFDGVVAVSSAVLEYLPFRLAGVRPTVINNGLPKLRFEKEDFVRKFPEIAAKCKNKFKLLSIGRLSPEKGLDILIQAVAKIVVQGLDAFLVIVGEGAERLNLSRLVKDNNLSDRVHFLGYQERAFRYIPYFDVFTLTSYTEGLPVSLLEAMQAGVPIVATPVGEIATVLDQGRLGVLTSPGDPNHLSEVLQAIYENPETAKLKAKAAQRRAISDYDTEEMANNYLKLYRKVIIAKERKMSDRGK